MAPCGAGHHFDPGRHGAACRKDAPSCTGSGTVGRTLQLDRSAEVCVYNGARRSTALRCSRAGCTPPHARQRRSGCERTHHDAPAMRRIPPLSCHAGQARSAPSGALLIGLSETVPTVCRCPSFVLGSALVQLLKLKIFSGPPPPHPRRKCHAHKSRVGRKTYQSASHERGATRSG